MLRPAELEQLSRLLAGELDPEAERLLDEELARNPELAEALTRMQRLDELVLDLSRQSPALPDGALERAVAAAVPRRASHRWRWVAAAVVLIAVVAAWLTREPELERVAPRPEVMNTQTRVASVRTAPDAVVLEEGPTVSRLVSGTALYDGDFTVLVGDERLEVHGKVVISTNPPEGLAHVTALVTPTPEEADMIRRASMQWATATTLAVIVFSGEAQAQAKLASGQAWVKAPVKSAQPAKATPATDDGGECAPAEDRPDVFEVQLGKSPSVGPADAKVTVVLFSEAECSFCVKSHAVLKDLEKEYAGRVRFVFKHFPLPRHAGGRQAALALHAAHAQGKFWEMVESAYGSPVSSEGGLYDAQARALGLDLQQYRRDVSSPETAAVIDADIAEGHRLGLKGVPAWFVNGREVVGHRPLETMRQLVEAALHP